jgi:soluble lytic murein transglycosylase-like protein
MRAQPVKAARMIWAARSAASLSLIGLLAACAGNAPVANSGLTAFQEAAVYKSHAKANYAPPGPASDPWGPYVMEASRRFDVPDVWIREVMRVESGGYQFRATGELTTSPVGAMGLMQLMPETYDEMRGRYALGDDAFDPHNNILAGAAYLREMYDAFGSPGFLAAYNAGPARLED